MKKKKKNNINVKVTADFLEREPSQDAQKWRHVSEILAEEVERLRNAMDNLIIDLLEKDKKFADNQYVQECLSARNINHE